MKNRLTQSIIFILGSSFAFSQSIDSIGYHSRKFENLKQKYNTEEFNYDEKFSEVNASAWERFWRAVGQFFEQLFNFLRIKKGFTFLIKNIKTKRNFFSQRITWPPINRFFFIGINNYNPHKNEHQ